MTMAGYYRHPSIQGDAVVFTCDDDLWSVHAEGGVARRLTAGRGRASFPVLSPDGTRLAFGGKEDGPLEVYCMDASGGPAERLTWTQGMASPVAWSRDGKEIWFSSNHGQPFLGAFRLHAVSATGGPTRLLPYGLALKIALEPDGAGVLLGVNAGDPARWKRYRGGTAGRLWIDRKGDGEFRPLLDLDGNVAGPMWFGGRIWFLSDHEGHGNLYSCTPGAKDLRRHTDHEDFYVRFPATDGRRIVYQAGADLYLFDPADDAARRIEISLHSPRTQRARKYVSASRHLETARLHPQGHSIACAVRGGAYSFPLWEGAPLRHGRVSSARYRLPCWLPDGKRIAAVTDETGEERLVLFRADGSGRPRRLRGEFGRIVALEASPTEPARLALTNHRQELWVVEVAGGRAHKVETCTRDRIESPAWSPDGRWLAYSFAPDIRTRCLHLYDTKTRQVHEITRPEFHDYSPSFDSDGKYLHFLSARCYHPVMDSHFFDYGFPRGARPFLIPLSAETSAPFALATREPRPPHGNGPGEPKPPAPGEGDGKKKKAPEVRIDLEGLADRVAAYPVDEARCVRLHAGRGRVFFSSLPVEGSTDRPPMPGAPPESKARLAFFDLERNREETLLDGITSFSISADAQSLLVRKGNRLRAVSAMASAKELSDKPEPGRETGWIDLDRLRVAVVPGDEWRQMFLEAWRLQRDQFWTPDMSAVDWESVRARYLPLVERVSSRLEFSDLLWELQGELGTSHCYELGGDYLPEPPWHQGLLGADLEYAPRSRAWRIARIPRGDSWTDHAASPLAAPGLGIREGDTLLAIDGQELGADRTPGSCLVHQAGREVVLTVRSRGSKARPRRVVVKTLPDETPLRYRDWVESNRETVHRVSKGRVGYIHIPDMGPRGFAEFHRSWRREMDRDGLVVDVRWNGGGNVSDLLLQRLLRRRVGYDRSRWQGSMPYPHEAPMGPMVALTNEYAGSDGDIFSHCFKLFGLGPLLGKRTWGGVVGIWPRHALVDGTVTTQPEFAFWFEDVGYDVENRGTDPDIEVEFAPQDHAAGRDPQLDRALKEILRILRATKPRVPKLEPRPGRRPPRLPPR